MAAVLLAVTAILAACGSAPEGGSAEASTSSETGTLGVLPTPTGDAVETPDTDDTGDDRPLRSPIEIDTPTAGPVGDGVDGPVVRHVQPYWDEAMLEEVAGVLVLEDDCLWLDRPEWKQRYPVVWPAATVWDSENRTVVTPAGEALRIGEPVIGGGGYNDVRSVEFFAGTEARQLVEGCVDDTADQVAIVNNQANAIKASRS